MPLDEFQKMVESKTSLAQILNYFEFAGTSGNYNTLKRRLEEENIDYSHIKMGQDSNKGRKFSNAKKTPLNQVMVKNSDYNRQSLKRRLLKNGMLKNKCYICEQEPEWNGEKLVLIIDHINGDRYDNRLENLRMLCPNCNAQQITFSGRNNHKQKKKYYCNICKKEITRMSKLCISCSSVSQRKVKWTDKEELQEDIKSMSWLAIGRKYNVSDAAVRKWARKYNLI